MRLIAFRLLVASSLLCTASAAVRPRYGGTLHIALRAAPISLDPVDFDESDGLGWRNISVLLFDTLVSLDAQGRPQPALATSWQTEPGNRRWQFSLRPPATFADGSPLTAEAVAASLRKANPAWKVIPAGNTVVIERDSPAPDLPAELALPRNGVAKRDSGRPVGTGPFAVSQWEPGKKLLLTARDEYWGGRPFLDAIEVDLGKNLRDQMMAFDLGQVQLIEVAPEQLRRLAAENRRVQTSYPMELLALVFSNGPSSPEDAKQREALALSIDRSLLNDVVFQAGGEPTGALLPNWLTGYGFLFSANANMTQAQQLRAEIPRAAVWTLGFDANDTASRLVAERIVLQAQDAGLRLQLAKTSNPDLRLIRVPLLSFDPHVALSELAATLGLPQPTFKDQSPDELYAAENALLGAQRVIPLLHLRSAWAVAANIGLWNDARDGMLHLPDIWIEAGKP